jgi:hypothetical protein
MRLSWVALKRLKYCTRALRKSLPISNTANDLASVPRASDLWVNI